MQIRDLMHPIQTKSILVILVLALSCSLKAQNSWGVFHDTSVYFIHQRDSLRPVQLTSGDLALADDLFLRAIREFNQRETREADSLHLKKKQRKAYVVQINPRDYLFRLTPSLKQDNQKTIYISGTCKEYLVDGHHSGKAGSNWKREFVDGHMVLDGGSCFIYLLIDLGTKTCGPLGMNGKG